MSVFGIFEIASGLQNGVENNVELEAEDETKRKKTGRGRKRKGKASSEYNNVSFFLFGGWLKDESLDFFLFCLF